MSPAAKFALPASAPVAVYEREIDASVDRIWENILDWEHLPYLHSQAFSSVQISSADDDGWRAEVGLPGLFGGSAEFEVMLDRERLRYLARTLAGPGAGTEVVTTLLPRGPHRTGIRVDIHLPFPVDDGGVAVGEFYRALYNDLWDQDEVMMRERQRILDTQADGGLAGEDAAGDAREVSLGRMIDLAPRLPLEVELGGRTFRVASIGGQLVAYDTRCPHRGGPLGVHPLKNCDAVCGWHGYRFDVRTGASNDGRELRMGRPAIVEVGASDGEVRLRLA